MTISEWTTSIVALPVNHLKVELRDSSGPSRIFLNICWAVCHFRKVSFKFWTPLAPQAPYTVHSRSWCQVTSQRVYTISVFQDLVPVILSSQSLIFVSPQSSSRLCTPLSSWGTVIPPCSVQHKDLQILYLLKSQRSLQLHGLYSAGPWFLHTIMILRYFALLRPL